jgi:hypothetical protein
MSHLGKVVIWLRVGNGNPQQYQHWSPRSQSHSGRNHVFKRDHVQKRAGVRRGGSNTFERSPALRNCLVGLATLDQGSNCRKPIYICVTKKLPQYISVALLTEAAQ